MYNNSVRLCFTATGTFVFSVGKWHPIDPKTAATLMLNVTEGYPVQFAKQGQPSRRKALA